MRLTKYEPNKNSMFPYKLRDEEPRTELDAIHKLGQLEDIEDELGIDLVTLFKILKTKECYSKENGECLIMGINKNGVILMPKAFPYGECEFTRPFSELGKTWALDKKELL